MDYFFITIAKNHGQQSMINISDPQHYLYCVFNIINSTPNMTSLRQVPTHALELREAWGYREESCGERLAVP